MPKHGSDIEIKRRLRIPLAQTSLQDLLKTLFLLVRAQQRSGMISVQIGKPEAGKWIKTLVAPCAYSFLTVQLSVALILLPW